MRCSPKWSTCISTFSLHPSPGSMEFYQPHLSCEGLRFRMGWEDSARPPRSSELLGYRLRQAYSQRLLLSLTLSDKTSTVSELRLAIVEKLSPPNKRGYLWPCLGLWPENYILSKQGTLTRSTSSKFFHQANSSCLIKELTVKAQNPAAINYWQSMWIRDKKKSFFLHASDSK